MKWINEIQYLIQNIYLYLKDIIMLNNNKIKFCIISLTFTISNINRHKKYLYFYDLSNISFPI
jgi:hypothetical protein